ncbi:MAG: LytTR family transcriptional regulator DNA-binding domain-containing protein [Ruminococcus sp.]|nr:LytTR family transcriptional regulator DNA-binding domain-containing protein [Ruminococcus sp.]
MLDIYICGERAGVFSELGDMCFRYLMKGNYDADVYYLSEKDIPASAAVYMIPLNNDTEGLSKKFRNLNRGNYIVVLIDKAADFRKAVTPGISPSGLLIKPWNISDVKMLLDELYADHKNSGAEHTDLEMFRFRQRAKEYSLPYEKILYFESRSKKIAVRTDTQEFEFYDTLDSIAGNAPEYFMKIHKSFVVNLSRIVSADYRSLTVEFDDGSAAFMSRTYKNEFKERFGKRSEKYAHLLHNG